MMKDGRLVWHRSGSGGGKSYAYNHDNDWYVYAIWRNSSSLWELSFGKRKLYLPPGEERTRMGSFFYLKEARLAGDIHHHEWIRHSDNEQLKDYISVYPLPEMDYHATIRL